MNVFKNKFASYLSNVSINWQILRGLQQCIDWYKKQCFICTKRLTALNIYHCIFQSTQQYFYLNVCSCTLWRSLFIANKSVSLSYLQNSHNCTSLDIFQPISETRSKLREAYLNVGTYLNSLHIKRFSNIFIFSYPCLSPTSPRGDV